MHGFLSALSKMRQLYPLAVLDKHRTLTLVVKSIDIWSAELLLDKHNTVSPSRSLEIFILQCTDHKVKVLRYMFICTTRVCQRRIISNSNFKLSTPMMATIDIAAKLDASESTYVCERGSAYF